MSPLPGRRQLPVRSPVGLRALGRGALGALGMPPGRTLEAAVARRCGLADAADVVLTSSGTAALVLAMRLLAPPGGTIALPGYGCVDLAAAAIRARVRVRVYDVDPRTLGPDLASLEACLARGVDVLLVAHLHGLPVDMAAVRASAVRAGVPILEDAAQAAGATLDGRPLGAYGDVAILSFGRGKGMTSGEGGALLLHAAGLRERLRAGPALGAAGGGVATLFRTAVQWLLGRPAIYGVPARIPALRLGEMVYHPAHEPRMMDRAARALLAHALDADGEEVRVRRAHAVTLSALAGGQAGLCVPRLVAGAEPGWLRFPVLDDTDGRTEDPAAGILRGYPQALLEQPPLREVLHPGEPATPGAERLRARLFTLPTHGFVTPADLATAAKWFGALASRARQAPR